MAYDIVLKGGMVVDGTGETPYLADVGIKGGRIAEIGRIADAADQTIDVTGLCVAPGVIDVHTHYDAQICWDGSLTSSVQHGTTTVITGNCGIGVAPNRPEQRMPMLQDMVVLEGLSYDVLEAGMDWQFETFPQYLDYLRKRGLGANVAPLVPLSPLRRYVMGDDSTERGATPAERAQIAGLLREALDAGAMGWGATLVRRQVGYKGKPQPCTMADDDELRAYCNVLRDAGHGVIQVNILESIAKPSDAEIARLDLLLAESGRPVTYSGAMHRNDDPEAVTRMLERMEPLRLRGAWPQSTIMPICVDVDLHRPMMFGDVVAFKEAMGLGKEKQKEIYRDTAWRARAWDELKTGRKLFSGSWENSTVSRVGSAAMEKLIGRRLKDIATERGTSLFDTLLDISLEDDLDLKIMGDLFNANFDFLRHHIADPRVLLGLHDGGAHVDMFFQAGFPTYMLGHWVREEGAMTLEHAVKRLTSEPADYFGFRDRGRIKTGLVADLMVFDPATVGSPRFANQRLFDLPGGGMHLNTVATGMEYVLVNGEILFKAGAPTGALPGRIINDKQH